MTARPEHPAPSALAERLERRADQAEALSEPAAFDTEAGRIEIRATLRKAAIDQRQAASALRSRPDVEEVARARIAKLEEALRRLLTECEIEGLADRAGFDCWMSMALEVLNAPDTSTASLHEREK